MKDKGYIDGETKKTPKGPNKVILSLTEKGNEEYYSRVIESARVFHEYNDGYNYKANGSNFSQFF